jgi:uncharacterized tellurite resistance protein B-like protein
MTKEHLFETYGEYILFLFIHVANADFTVKGTEIDVILQKMEDYFPEIESEDELRDMFVRLTSEYDNLNDSDINNVIYSNFKKFEASHAATSRILVDLHEIINADGYIDESETKVLEDLKNLLGI